MRRETARRGRSLRKQGKPLKSPRAKAKAKVEERPKAKEKASNATCAEGIGHPARLCPSEGWVNDLEQDAPEGEDTNEDEMLDRRRRRDTPTGVPWQRVLFDELSTGTQLRMQ